MFCLKAKNLMVFLLASLLILSLTNASCAKYSIAAESDNAASATANEQLDTVEIEEIYQDEGVFIRHIKHVPISKSPFPPSESNHTNFNESKAAPTVDSSNVKANIPSVAETVYGNTGYLPLTPEDNSVTAEVYGANDLILESDTPKDRSVSGEVYGEFSIKNKKGMYTAAFTPHSGSQLLRFSNGDASLLMSPLNPRSVSSSVYQNTITYENIYPDTNIRYTLESNRLKEDIIVQKYTGMSDFYFQLSVSNAVYDKNSEGEICFFDVVTAKPLFYLAKPYAVDKNGNRCDLVTLELTKEGLKLTVDQDWLKKAAYPITIDPTIYLLDATFTRASVAYKKDGTQVSANQPRYEAGKFGQAIMVEEGTTNLFNNPSVESDNSGWYIDGAERSSAAKWHGAYSVRVYGNGSSAYRRVWTPVAPISQSGTHAISFYLKGQWANVSIQAYNASGTVPSGCVGGPSSITWLTTNPMSGGNASTWTRYVAICSGWPTNTANVRVRVSACDGTANSNVVFVDAISCEAKPYVTSFTTPTRSGEAMTIPTTGVISAGQGSIEVSAYIDPTGVHSANNPNWSMVFAMADVQSSPLEKNQISIRRIPNSTNWGIWFCNGDGNLSTVNLGSITTAGWYSFGVTWQAGVGGSGYLNGVNKGNVAASYLPTSITAPVAYIGSWRGHSNYFNQLIDDLRISNRVRTTTEIQAAYNSALPLPVDANTTCKLTFDDNTQGGVSDTGGTGIKPYWNYTSASLGGGWSFSVNTYNLNMMLNKTLFQVPGRGIPIGESITYNSQDTASGPLGPGWHLGTAVSVVEQANKSVIYTGGDGASYTFAPNGSGGYTAPKGIYLTLQKTGTGNFTITDKDQNVYTFQNGKPTQSVDRNNNTTTYTYDGNGRLAQSRDPSGRSITYSYNTSGRLTGVTAPANRTYQLTYQNGYLTGITDPNNQTTTLNYDTSGPSLSFTDPLNRVTSFICYSNGQLQAFNDARSNGQDIYQTSFSQSTQSNRVVTTITDPRGNASKYYHDSSTGNLVQYSDPLGNNWNYQWTDNNLITITDVKGSTTYEYDSKGNVTKTTDTVDSNPANNIVKTMTYDEYNQLLEVVDGSGRKTSYKYDNRGNLLATSNPDVKESNGRKYDQYGNVIEYSPRISSSRTLLKNGNFETAGTGGELADGWTRAPGAAAASLEGCRLYGNAALKLSSGTSTTDLFYQRVEDLHPYDKLTLRADVKLENVEGSGGAIIKLDYPFGNEYDETYQCRGTGTFPLIITSKMPKIDIYDYVDVYVGLFGASGTVWFDGVQLENIYCTSEDYNNNPGFSHYGYALSDFNLIENSSFEIRHLKWLPNPYNTQASYVYQPWEGIMALCINYGGSMYQDVPVYGGEQLTLSGMVKGSGAYLKVDFYDAADQIITGSSAETGRLTDAQEYTRLSCLASAPAQAKYARVQLVLENQYPNWGIFDTIKLVHRKTEKYTYSASGNYPATSEDALGKRSSSAYNENTGTKTSFTDALNNTTSYGYDNLNRLIQVTEPLSRRAYNQYDHVGNLTATRDPRSSSSSDNTYRTAYNHNNINQLSSLVDPLNANTANTYDRAGNLTRVLLPNGLAVDYTYDSANRLTRETLSDGKYFSYSYDGANNLIRVADQDNNSYTWEYDGAGRVISSTDNFNYKLYYRWDKSNNLIDEHTEIINTYDNHIYDSNNRLVGDTRSRSYYNYDENGRLYQKKYNCNNFDDMYRTIDYYPNGWCKTIQDSGFPERYRMNYSYYDNGNISAVSSWAGEESFSYDGNGRLIHWSYTPRSGSPVQESYQYDAAGNLLTKGSATYTYNNANRITNAGFTYDNNGNMTSDGTYNYTYNAENQLIQVKRKSDNSLVATYAYNFNGLRKSKTVYSGQTATTTNFHWDAFGRLIRESNQSGQQIAVYSYDSSGNLVGIRQGTDNLLYFIKNTRGDIVSLSDYSGYADARYHYDPWGKQISYSGILTKPQPFRYAGYYFDEETGLYYLKSRYYSPTLGRFLTKDSIEYIKYGNPQTLNLYTYAENNPISNIDPNGEGILSTIVSAIVEHAISKAISSLSHSSSSSSKKKKTTLLASSILVPYSKEVADSVIDPPPRCLIFFGGQIQITGFSRHAINQAISRDGVGVSSEAILDAVNNPTKVIPQVGGTIKYVGERAVVILNEEGKVVTTWARNRLGWRIFEWGD